ncbi:MAG: D-alanyl-D-alanine carboxypeptidase, partial [Gammaproteobacteria bacterium]|nr:D-alanyl-D-alanine carboxypeptidase [Gammaproteobacteria bacterium]
KKRISLFVWLGLISVIAQAAPPPLAPLAAKAYVLMDFHTGMVIAAKDADVPLEPASLTKMMTTYVVEKELRAGHIRLTDEVKISKRAWLMGGSRMFIEVGKNIALQDLLHGVIVHSGNDASVALAEYVSGTEEAFVELMNKTAAELDMRTTHFMNATGLPQANHFSSAADLARLGQAIIRDFPEHYAWYSEKEYTFNRIKQLNRNRLLFEVESVDGIKTGHTDTAGYCIALSAARDTMRFVGVILGTKSESARIMEGKKMLNYGFQYYETHKIYSARQPVANLRVWKGAADSLAVGVEQDFYITYPRGEYGRLISKANIDKRVMAPVARGQVLGNISIILDKQVLVTRDLAALNDVRSGGMIGNAFDDLRLVLE